ncbi:MAG: lipase family protein [Leptolyngbyaceae cyanobacterium]
MVKLNRRKLLLTGLAAGTGSAIAAQRSVAQTPLPLRRPASPTNTPALSDLFDFQGTSDLRVAVSNSPITPPVPYDRAWSKLLIRCCALAYEQFETGKTNPSFDGSIKGLPSYIPELNGFTQVASFKGLEDLAGFSLKGTSLPEILKNAPLEKLGNLLPPELQQIFQGVTQRVLNPRLVFLGYVLRSDQANIIVFRGSQTLNDWLANVQARQTDYVLDGVKRGRVHRGFQTFYDNLETQIKNVYKLLNPNAPVYLTGHSLGAVLATLTAVDIANFSFKGTSQVRLYSYASPRLGDPTFAQFFNTTVPNTYRVFNIADMVPEVPASETREGEYRHVGQFWSFLNYTGNLAPNHETAIYREAIDRQVEINSLPNFPV